MPGQHELRNRPVWRKTAAGVTTTPVVIYLPEHLRRISIVPSARCFVGIGSSGTAPSTTIGNAVTTITTTGTPTGGSFKLTAFPGQKGVLETAALTYDESAADIKTALIALAGFLTGDITAAGGALPTAVTLTWTAAFAGAAPLIIPSSVALTGGTNASVKVSVTTQPVNAYGYLETAGATYTLSNDDVGAADRYLYIASTTATVDYFLTGYA